MLLGGTHLSQSIARYHCVKITTSCLLLHYILMNNEDEFHLILPTWRSDLQDNGPSSCLVRDIQQPPEEGTLEDL